MSREVKVFQTSYNPDVEPYPFELQFTVLSTGEKQPLRLQALGNPGAGGDLTVAAIMRYDPDTGKRKMDLNGLREWYRRVLLDDGYERLSAALDDPLLGIDMADLFAVFKWLTEEYAARPTMPSSASSNGQRETSLSSTGSPS